MVERRNEEGRREREREREDGQLRQRMKKRTVGRAAKSGMSDATGIGVAEPELKRAIKPTASNASEGSHWASPPMFCTHLPVFIPMMLRPRAIVSSTSDAPAA